MNWSKGVDAKGRPIPNPEKEPAPDGRLIAPDEGGLTNYRSPSFDPKTGLFIVMRIRATGIYFAKPADGTFRLGGRGLRRVGEGGAARRSIIRRAKLSWTHELGPNASGAGVLTTDSGVMFTGDSLGNVLALRTSDGKTLWHAGRGADAEFADYL